LKKIAVIGSINVDMVVKSNRRPMSGETIFGEDFSIHPGGKGANQAVAIARLGGDVKMLGCVGDDLYGQEMIKNLRGNGVDADHVKRMEGVTTGIASINVAENDNSIIVVKGANNFVDRAYIDSVINEIIEVDFVLLQYEIPMDTVEYVIEICREKQIKVIVNPAPYQTTRPDMIERIDFIIPNEHEASKMFDNTGDIDHILKKHPGKMIVTLGHNGAAYNDGNSIVYIPAMDDVAVVDTTGAGDTFVGAFTKRLADGGDKKTAIMFAQVASGLSIEKFGAQEGMPSMAEVMERQSTGFLGSGGV
jgi:ribokinase